MNEPGHPLIGRGKSFLEQLLRIAQTRLEMLSVELQQEKIELARELRLAAIAAICAWLAGLALVLWVALVLPPDLRSLMLGGLFVVLAVASVVAMLALRRRARRPSLFSRIIQQLRMDRASLSQEP